ncbi:ABC transporter ATP-binding protein [Jiangella muralis]|uniref:ABC transporter ATP-binding protein n=1 Tax=Jiangella muralis TaxID=702383 RepID=UPI00069EBED2|nr:dipeptide/oligopeptide/nickel ABC transporter ATP-binding protein [Jiangella muralis]
MALVEINALSFSYGRAPVLKDLSFSIEQDSTLGIVGESGSGKSTLIRVLCGLMPVQSGIARYDGRDISEWLDREPRGFRRRNQIVFQSPASSLDPRMRVGQSLAEPTKSLERRTPSDEELGQWLTVVGLGPEALQRYPHQLSGGQLQRVAIARALTVNPTMLYADEPTSALDVSIQAQVLNLLIEIRRRLGLTMVIVSHDLAVVGRVCEQVIVMRNGEIVESGPTASVLRYPEHEYTKSLVNAARAVSLGASHDAADAII